MAKLHLKIILMDMTLQDIFTVVSQGNKQTNKQIKPKQQQNPTKKKKIKENVLLVKLKLKIK